MSEKAASPAKDRRALRTRRALRDAFLRLLIERGFDDVSVQEICQRADIGRSTFYMHFHSKEDLLDGGLGDLKEELRRQAAARSGEAGCLPFARGLIEHVDEQRRLFRALIGKRSGHVVQTRFRAMVLELVAERLTKTTGEEWQRDAAAHYLAGAIVQLLAWWIDKGSSVSAQEIEREMMSLSAGAISALYG